MWGHIKQCSFCCFPVDNIVLCDPKKSNQNVVSKSVIESYFHPTVWWEAYHENSKIVSKSNGKSDGVYTWSFDLPDAADIELSGNRTVNRIVSYRIESKAYEWQGNYGGASETDQKVEGQAFRKGQKVDGWSYQNQVVKKKAYTYTSLLEILCFHANYSTICIMFVKKLREASALCPPSGFYSRENYHS